MRCEHEKSQAFGLSQCSTESIATRLICVCVMTDRSIYRMSVQLKQKHTIKQSSMHLTTHIKVSTQGRGMSRRVQHLALPALGIQNTWLKPSKYWFWATYLIWLVAVTTLQHPHFDWYCFDYCIFPIFCQLTFHPKECRWVQQLLLQYQTNMPQT